ncbi:MAG: orotate phosphoribosyltransferase [Candidatus Tectimicrobiota bacterium]|nr:MAG: orotate phosphoribosyltransferase [Candidatus Tectomicrobia bacterium]
MPERDAAAPEAVAAQVLHLLRTTGALLEGHFLLSSGLHSDRYVQCARLLQYPPHAEALGRWLAARFAGAAVRAVVSPALGGILIGHEVARALGARALFGEREAGVMTLRRGLELQPGERVLVVEDVITTGGSVREVLALVARHGGEAVGVGAILDRSGGQVRFAVPLHALATLEVPVYSPQDCPLCRQGRPLSKPGSRQR